MPFLSQLIGHPAERIAIVDEQGEHTFGSLVEQARELADVIKKASASLASPRVAFLAGRRSSSAVALLAIWLADGVAVPLDPLMSLPEWQWRLQDLEVDTLLYAAHLKAEAYCLAHSMKVKLISTSEGSGEPVPLKIADPEKSALILFSNRDGTRPVPVVHSFSSLAAQVQTQGQAWHWQPEDRLLHVLPLSNYHGLINGLLGAMASGSCCELMEAFKVQNIWHRLASGNISLFMAVPTMYQYLLDYWNKRTQDEKKRWLKGTRRLRQSIIGPHSVPASTRRQWQEITGSPLSFRYGMTECGLVLQNTLNGEVHCGIKGQPVPGVSLRLVDGVGHESEGIMGELEVRSSQLFSEYFGNPALTRNNYHHGWFRTGFLAVREGEIYSLFGQRDLDMIETGGYQVSAKEVETLLESYPGISESAVIGIPCDHWGEAICAFIVPSSGQLSLSELKAWLASVLPSYKVPSRLEIQTGLPRNTAGVVDKQLLKENLFARRS